ncbi:MAG TPA: hypothetical protein VHE81_06080, partial [Lacipirellulaceae bacterium]|nr:hypothetical protein [Lacipirellulaceae bacterium]
MSIDNDLAQHIDRLRHLPQHENAMLRVFFERHVPIHVARAPGRLDVMGGIGDYSGSLVLELPIAEAAFAAAQRSKSGDVTIASLRNGGRRAIMKTIAAREWSELRDGDYAAARQFFAQDPDSAWAAYIAGPILVLLREVQSGFDSGVRVLIDSQVPEGKGVSSSAAVEVATMRAVAPLIGVTLAGEELARLCQRAENHIVGAPCGIMDQMTSAMGHNVELLALRCQPATVEGYVPVPPQLAFWGIDSGIRHAVSGSEYTSVRCGAFMGYRIIAEAAGLEAKASNNPPHIVEIDDPFWNGYLANITPDEFQNRFVDAVPEQMPGREFLKRYTGTTDRVTRVDP